MKIILFATNNSTKSKMNIYKPLAALILMFIIEQNFKTTKQSLLKLKSFHLKRM